MKTFVVVACLLGFGAFASIGAFVYYSGQVDWVAIESGKPSFGCSVVYSPGYYVGEEHSRGKSLFDANCAACHKSVGRLVGPQFAGILDKYADDKEWLYNWVRNSQGMVKNGDVKAVALFEKYNKMMMTSFPTLADEDIEAILTYSDAVGE